MHVRPVSAERRIATFLTLMTLLVIGSFSTTHAQLPGTLSYQGQILADDGRPVADGLHRIDVAFYDDEFASEPLWRESHLVEFSGGLFSIYLGSINPLNLPFDRRYWLGVSFDGRGEMAERTPLSSSPYAVRSQVAGELDGGAVRSINGQQGALRIVGTGSAVVTEQNGTITIGTTLPKSLMGDGKVDLTPVDAQIATDGYTLININDLSGSDSDLIDLQVDSSDVFLLESNGDLTTTGMVTGVGASFSHERVQNVADPSAAQDAATKNYVDSRDGVQTSDLQAYADQAEADAKAYSDAQDATQTAYLEGYADQAEADARAYSDAQDATQTAYLEGYADQAEADARAYSDAQDAAQNITGEPLLTFEVGTAKLTNNRMLAAGTGVSLTDAGSDNGTMTVAIGQDVAATASPTFDGLALNNVSPSSTSTEVLVSNGGAIESRSANSLASEFDDDFWMTEGNAGTNPGTNYVGTSDAQALHLYVNGGIDNSLVLNTNGSVQRGTDGDPRGAFATDLQISRTGSAQVASGAYGTVGGGQNNTADAGATTVGGGVGNEASHTWATVGGGSINRATGWGTAVGGGRANHADGHGSSIAGGVYNNALGLYSAIPGGRDLTLSGSGSFGFLSGVDQSANNTNPGTRPMSVSANDVALFGNTDMWLANNDGASSQLRFYESNSTTGHFPNGTNYTSFEAGAQSVDISYTLPTSAPTADGHVLTSTTTGTMSWSNSLSLSSLTTTDATVTNLTADVVEGDVADFSNSSSTTPTLTLDNSGSGGIAIDIAKGGVQLGYLEYTALNENKADNAGGYPRISSSVALAVVTATDGNDGPYSVRVPASGVNGQILYVINASGSKIKLRDTKEGAIDVNDDRGVSVIYYGNGWRVIALQSGGGGDF